MKKAFIATVAIGMAVAGLTLASRKAEDTAPKEAIPVRYVSAEGKVEALPGAEVEVGSEITGRIERFFVKEGDLVKKGGLIAILENRDIKAKLREAETEAAVARARLKETASGAREEEIRRAGASLDGAVADMHLTSAELERYERLHRQGMVSQAELDQKQSAYKIALSRVKEAEEAKTLLEKGPKQETLKVNEVMIKQAEATVEYYKRLLDKTIIKAPISGKVIRKYAQEGELVNLSSAETLLAAIADIEKVRINAEVDETDIGKIKIGDPVDVTSDAYTGKVFKGEIEEIADYVGARNVRPNNPAKNMDMKVVQVKIELKEKTPLRLGMTVDVRIMQE
ncbi:MAG TPA: efflux RND transporter periplasmic adaptor subunit [Thermodesulfobacteriota bacterium]|nr:efflux RND transporter periplasmic adaptor subunit [Thermodesulfobacteriota bacterium]